MGQTSPRATQATVAPRATERQPAMPPVRSHTTLLALLLSWTSLASPLAGQSAELENAWVRVTRNAAPCAAAVAPVCGDRVVVSLGAVEIDVGGSTRRLGRGDILVFGPGEAHGPPRGGPFFEVAIKPDHPPGESAGEEILPEKNQIIHDAPDFFVFEEGLAVGDTRSRHSHSQRVVFQLNATRLQQWPEGQPEILRDIAADRVGFNTPVIHTVRNVGELPLRGIVIEFKTAPAPGRRLAWPGPR